jgi:oligogalacturonide transporter
MSASATTGQLSLWRKIGYGLGDIFGGGSGVIISFYYLYFLTDVVRIHPGLAGTIILLSKIYDAVTDPLEGFIADRTRTRLGRRRPYLLAGIPLIFLSFWLLFFPTTLSQEWQRFVFALFSYLFFSTVMSIVMLNYTALQAELTLDYHERAALGAVRIFFSTLASIIGAVLPLEIVQRFPDVYQGYRMMGLFFGAFFALPFIATFLVTRERPDFQRPPTPFEWRRTFLFPFHVRVFAYTLLMYLLAFVTMDVVSSIVIYFMKYYLGRGEETQFVSGTLLIAQAFSLPFYLWLSRRTAKHVGYAVGVLVWMVMMLASLLFGPAQPSFLVYLFSLVVGLGTGGVVVMIYAIFPDIPDVDELATGERREGIYAALFTFTRKVSSALALFLVSQALALAGYEPPVEQIVGGVRQLVEQPQSSTFILTLRLLFALAPVLLLMPAIYLAWWFPLTPRVHQRLQAVLEEYRQGKPESAIVRDEARWLKQHLIGGGS